MVGHNQGSRISESRQSTRNAIYQWEYIPRYISDIDEAGLDDIFQIIKYL